MKLFARERTGTILTLLLIILLGYFSITIKIIVVSGNSMYPTLNDREIVFAKKNPSKISEGEIIIFRINDEVFIKRVIATHGSNVKIDGETDKIYINGVETIYSVSISDGTVKEIIIPENKFFVIGDNHNESIDSRNEIIGLIDISAIEAVCIQITRNSRLNYSH